MMTLLALLLGAAAGGSGRYLTTQMLDRHLGTGFPWGTLTVNLFGAFLAGLITATLAGLDVSQATRVGLLAGFCGSYTTVSSWSLQTLALWQGGFHQRAVLNLVATTLLGLVAVCTGLWLGRTLVGAA